MQPDNLSATFSALADPTRRAILARLASGGASVTELAEPFAMSLPAVSKHLKVLERAGLVARGREAQWRPSRLDAAPLKEAAEWLHRYRRFWDESFDRLDDYLRGLNEEGERTMAENDRGAASAGEDFLITRVFDAPRDLVWQAWTEAEHLKRWWGPKGFTVLACTIELTPGGVFHYGLRTPDAGTMWGRWVFREIVPQRRLVFVASFSDAAGGVARHPFPGDWPLETLSTVTFDDQDGGTAVTVRWTALTATDAERQAFAAGFDSMRQGWTGTLDQLAEHLAKG